MQFDVITLFPELINAVAGCGVTGKAVDSDKVRIRCWNPRDYTSDRHRTVDDRPYGGGPGMVMKFEPLRQAIQAARQANPQAKCVYMSPQGKPLTQVILREAAIASGWIFLAGRYEGIDQRLLDQEVDAEWSLGDYVLSGGELAAMVLIDGISRLVPGVLGHDESAEQDSFAGDGLLDCPHYTRPDIVAEHSSVPEVLLQGNHQSIACWRRQQMLGQTWQKRPDILQKMILSADDKALLDDYISQQNQV